MVAKPGPKPLGRAATTPLSPQPIETMRARFVAALMDFVEVERAPGVHEALSDPAQIFDFEDGVRMIFGYSHTWTEIPVLVMSASMDEGSPAAKKYKPAGQLIAFVEHVGKLLEQISPIALAFAAVSGTQWGSVQFMGPPRSVVERLAERFRK